MTLPLMPHVPATPVDAYPPMKHELRSRPAPLVLIAEDEGEIADILGAYLARSGLRSARAADGEAAWPAIASCVRTWCCWTCRCPGWTAGGC